jgi:hypothetical protein
LDVVVVFKCVEMEFVGERNRPVVDIVTIFSCVGMRFFFLERYSERDGVEEGKGDVR